MSPIAGWYDDPRDDARLRYWDGDAWTDHVIARDQAAPAAEGATAPSGPDAPVAPAASPHPPAAPQWVYPGGPPAQQQQWNYGGAPQQTWPQAPPPPSPGFGQMYRVTTPDGAGVTSWAKRLGARLLDYLFIAIGGLPFTGYFLYKFFEAVSDQMNDTSRSAFNPTPEVMKWEASFAAMSIVISACYEVFCLRHWAATPGKRILDIRIRSWDRPGKLGWGVIARRVGFMSGLSVISLVPAVGVLAGIVALLDYLWPLWDKRRQALHDKFAGTVVVENPPSWAAPPQRSA